MAFSTQGEEHLKALQGMPARFRIGLATAAEMAGKLLVTTNAQGMQSSGGGPLYRGAKRPASLPGNYPAVQSGQLIGSMDYAVAGLKLEFGSKGAFNRGYDYAIGQNEGNSRIAPRPYLHLTVAKTQAQIEHLLGSVTWAKMIGG
jgi:hypothetical protein